MKSAFSILMVCLFFVACGEEIEPLKPLQKRMPNTLTLSTGDVVYDIRGEWDAIMDDQPWGKFNDIVTITQEGNNFVGIILKGNEKYHKGDELIKGELLKNGFKSIERNTVIGWKTETEGRIDEGCNKIVVKTDIGLNDIILVLTRK